MPIAISEKDSFWDRIKLSFLPKYAVGFSMAIVLIGLGVFMIDNNKGITIQDNLLAELTVEETNTYIVNHIEDFSTEDIVASLAIEDIKTVEDKISNKRTEPINKIEIPIITTPSTIPSKGKTAMEKAIEKAGGESILDDLNADDFEDEIEELF